MDAEPMPTRAIDAEETVWEGEPSPLLGLPTFAWCGLLSFLIVPIFVGAWKLLEIRSIKYRLSSQRLTVTSGVVTRRVEEIELYRVKDTALEEPLLLRLFGLANVVIHSSDRSRPVQTLLAVDEGEEVREAIRGLVEKIRDRKNVRELDV